MATSDPSDDALMKAYAAGDAAAFEQLNRCPQAALYRFVRRLLGSALAAQTDEVFQDTWLRVVNARERWPEQAANEAVERGLVTPVQLLEGGGIAGRIGFHQRVVARIGGGHGAAEVCLIRP